MLLTYAFINIQINPNDEYIQFTLIIWNQKQIKYQSMWNISPQIEFCDYVYN